VETKVEWVGKGPRRVTLTHRPTGVSASCDRFPSQIANYNQARKALVLLLRKAA
jgi:protein subunit release factor B